MATGCRTVKGPSKAATGFESYNIAPTCRGPWKRAQRCTLPALGFYEWPVLEDGKKQPY